MPKSLSSAPSKKSIRSANQVASKRPPWVAGLIPPHFWSDAANRRSYMDWLGKKLKYHIPVDWHRVNAADFETHHGASLLGRHFGKSVFRAVSETYPEHEWCEWLFEIPPRGFWLTPENRSRFLHWLGKKLGFRKLDDWYAISKSDFMQNGGRQVLKKDGSPAQIVMETFPKHDWKPWLFEMVPPGFWADPTNRRRYMDWLAKRLRIRKTEDWYVCTHRHFKENAGFYMLVQYYDESPVAALREYVPNYDWKPWLFAFPGSRFWKKLENRRQYLDWLGEKLGFKTAADWRELRHEHFADNHGIILLKRHYRRSLATAMREYWPGEEWEEWLFPIAGGRFWRPIENRRRYLRWLGQTLGFTKPEDWYKLKTKDVVAHHGSQLLSQYYGSSVARMLRELMPQHDWQDWKFAHIPRGFFNEAGNRRRYLDWLFHELRIRRPEDWYAITGDEIRAAGGDRLLVCMGSLCRALQEWRPDYNWKEWLFASSKQEYWKYADLRRRYLQWLAGILEYREPEDWLGIRSDDLLRHHGKVLLRRYRGSVVRVVMDNLPELDFSEEDFEATMIKSRRRKRKSASR